MVNSWFDSSILTNIAFTTRTSLKESHSLALTLQWYTEQMKTVRETRRTLGLAMMMKDEVEDLDRIINDYGSFFDKIYVTVTHKKTYDTLFKRFTNNPATDKLVELSYFKWIDHFGKARLYNQKQIKTDYWMWLDLDDEIEGVEKLHQVINYMEIKNLDAVVFQYDRLKRANLLEPGRMQWRERIIRTASKLKWSDKAVHENIYIEGDTDMILNDVIIKHRKTAEQLLASDRRNRIILEKEWRRAPNPEIANYLGAVLMDFGEYESAIGKILFVIEHSQKKMERIRAWQRLCECYTQTNRHDEALVAANECLVIDPNNPEPWYRKFKIYQAAGFHNAAMYCAETAMSKQSDGELAIQLGYDPTQYQYRGPFDIAVAYLSLGNVERAHELYLQVKNTAPEYIEELSVATSIRWDEAFERAYDEFKKQPPVLNDAKLNELSLLVNNTSSQGGAFEGSADRMELNYLNRLAGLPGIKNIGEIGFNAGRSSYAFLAAKPGTRVISFDLGEYDYVKPAKELIDREFPKRHELILGDSTETVPAYHKAHPNLKFDLIFVDGGHDYEIAKADIENMKKFATKDTILVTDDLTPWLPWGIGPTRAWTEALDEGLVIQDELVKDGEIVKTIEPPGQRIYVRGRYSNL